MTATVGTPPATAPLRPRADPLWADRLAWSAAHRDAGSHLRTEDIDDWLEERRRAHRFAVERVPLDSLDGWDFDPTTGNIAHRTGRFFTVEGLHAQFEDGFPESWRQPVINQPEVGILGILAQEFDGVLHFLMQAKMEPGNRNLLQLSPTVQATRSNYTRAHQGRPVRYLEHFVEPGGRVLADVLQSEHGAWFWHKANRNMVTETDAVVSRGPDHVWLTLGQLGELLRRDNLVNMDARTVLASLPRGGTAAATGAVLSDTELRSWFTGERARRQVHIERIPLAETTGWRRGTWTVEHGEGLYFRVVGVRVEAGSREVTGWSQPLFEPVGRGVVAFVARRFQGVPHVLVNARAEPGFLDTVELAPTVQHTPANYAHVPAEQRPPFLDSVLAAGPDAIRYEAVHSEEGGRFLNAESRYLVVEDDQAPGPAELPAGYQWATPAQLVDLAQYGRCVNVQARTLLAALTSRAVRW